jgi:lipopolysaccharide transport system ATP-binding protein
VSHNLQTVRAICDRAILLDAGRVQLDGNTEGVLSAYGQALRNLRIDENALVGDSSRRRGSGHIRITSVSVQDVSGQESFHFEMGDTVRIAVSYRVFEAIRGCSLYIGLRSNATNELITSVRHVITEELLPAGYSGTAIVELPEVYVRPGEYPLYFQVSEASLESRKFDVLDDAIHPLVMSAGDRRLFANYEPEQTVGYFSLPSRLIQSEPVRC